jgi:hypothetical protein
VPSLRMYWRCRIPLRMNLPVVYITTNREGHNLYSKDVPISDYKTLSPISSHHARERGTHVSFKYSRRARIDRVICTFWEKHVGRSRYGINLGRGSRVSAHYRYNDLRVFKWAHLSTNFEQTLRRHDAGPPPSHAFIRTPTLT